VQEEQDKVPQLNRSHIEASWQRILGDIPKVVNDIFNSGISLFYQQQQISNNISQDPAVFNVPPPTTQPAPSAAECTSSSDGLIRTTSNNAEVEFSDANSNHHVHTSWDSGLPIDSSASGTSATSYTGQSSLYHQSNSSGCLASTQTGIGNVSLSSSPTEMRPHNKWHQSNHIDNTDFSSDIEPQIDSPIASRHREVQQNRTMSGSRPTQKFSRGMESDLTRSEAQTHREPQVWIPRNIMSQSSSNFQMAPHVVVNNNSLSYRQSALSPLDMGNPSGVCFSSDFNKNSISRPSISTTQSRQHSMIEGTSNEGDMEELESNNQIVADGGDMDLDFLLRTLEPTEEDDPVSM
jgi:hypothetical protein